MASSKSPVRPKPGTTWGTVEHMNKSAIVESRTLPSKLQKLKERVRRDRSANAINDENREGSLYGRSKATSQLDQECERLRQSYN